MAKCVKLRGRDRYQWVSALPFMVPACIYREIRNYRGNRNLAVGAGRSCGQGLEIDLPDGNASVRLSYRQTGK